MIIANFVVIVGAKVGKNCIQCGAELPEGSKFCHECGVSIGENIPVNNSSPVLYDLSPNKRKNRKSMKDKIEDTGYYHNSIGNQFYNEMNYEAAIYEYNEALKLVELCNLYTAGAVYLINRGNAFFKIGNSQNAVWDYAAAKQLFGKYVFEWFHGDDWQNDVFCFHKKELKEMFTKYEEIEWQDLLMV